MTLTKFGWFIIGFWSMGIVVTIALSYFNAGTPSARLQSLILSMLGIISAILFCRESQSKPKTNNQTKSNGGKNE